MIENRNEPVFGICMGNQLTALAAGAQSYKLPLGNRYYNNNSNEHSYNAFQK